MTGPTREEVETLVAHNKALIDRNVALRERLEAAEEERDAAKKYMIAYAECDRIGTEAYRALEADNEALRRTVSDMEAAWLVAHGVDTDAALTAVQACRRNPKEGV